MKTINIYLKNDFISHLQSKDLAPSTIEHYVWDVEVFLNWIDKEELQILKTDILKYMEHLKNKRGLQNNSRARVLNSLNQYFAFLLKTQQVQTNPCALLKIRGTQAITRQRIYTPDELHTLCDNYYHLFVRDYDNSHIPKNQRLHSSLSRQRNHVILSLLIYQGLTTKETELLQLSDLDFMSATLKVKEHSLPLQATQMGVLMNYLQNIRPQLITYQTNKYRQCLFLTLPNYSQSTTNSTSLMSVFKPLKKQLKSIDKHFVNLQQIRTSVITHWLKTYGLRKTQVLAGHKSITSTERYLVNDMEDLINNIDNLHPFQ